jgi:hypothetical protein
MEGHLSWQMEASGTGLELTWDSAAKTGHARQDAAPEAPYYVTAWQQMG